MPTGPNHLLNRKINKQCNTKKAGANEKRFSNDNNKKSLLATGQFLSNYIFLSKMRCWRDLA